MTTKRIMLLGAGGQMGQTIMAEQKPAEWQIGAYTHAQLDITNHPNVRAVVEQFKPDIIINAAAMANVDAAEQNPDEAMAINFEAIANLAAICSTRDIPFLHLSTDYVFDGCDGERPYETHDTMNPLNVYGESKMMGEEALRHDLPWHVILRISSIFGPYGKNLLTNMLQTIDERDDIKGLIDVQSSPTSAIEIAKAIVVITDAIFKGQHGGFGTFHLCGAPPATRLEFMQAVMDAYAPYTTRRPKIAQAVSADLGPRAIRPTYSVLDCSKTKAVYGIEQKPWREGLTESMNILMRDRRKVA